MARKKPTGLTIARNGLTFTFSWKYTGKSMYYGNSVLYVALKIDGTWEKLSGGKRYYENIGASKTSFNYSIKQDDYFPKTSKKIQGIKFGIRYMSVEHKLTITPADYGWAESPEYLLYAPTKPEASISVSDTTENGRTISVNSTVSNNDNKPYYSLKYQTALVENWDKSYTSSKISWSKESDIHGPWSDSTPEKSTDLNNKSVARIVRVKSTGIAGESDYTYASHIFATPKQATITSGRVTEYDGRFAGEVTWNPNISSQYPINTMEVRYAVGQPNVTLEGMSQNGWKSVTITKKSDVSWESVGTVAPNGSSAGYNFNANSGIGIDSCVWFQIKSDYDKKSNYSNAYLAYYGKLATPVLTSQSLNGNNLTVNVSRKTEIDNTFVLVSIALSDAPNVWHDIGVIKDGNTGTFRTPNIGILDYKIKICEYVGVYVYTAGADYDSYTVKTKYMQSNEAVSDTVYMPKPPRNVSVIQLTASTVKLTWDWAWNDANEATISWADHEDAWESTDAQSEYDIKRRATSWTVANLERDTTYYFRVMLKNTKGEDEILSDWSNAVSLTLSSELLKPSITTNKETINIKDTIICTCSYSTFADVRIVIAEAIGDKYVEIIQSKDSIVELDVNYINQKLKQVNNTLWTTGSTHYLVCKIIKGDQDTEWSEPTIVNVIPDIIMTDVIHTLSPETETVDEETFEYLALKNLPLSAGAIGAGANGKTKVYIKRAHSYKVARPNEKNETRFEDEIIASKIIEGNGVVTIDHDDLIGYLDDGAWYRLIIEIQDAYRQVVSEEFLFRVDWEHQPEMPVASVKIDKEEKISIFKVVKPTNYVAGDTFDVYRLSSDYPELILENGVYGVDYVDPYPAFGKKCGHRIVNKTINDDYVTANNEMSWVDFGEKDEDTLEYKKAVIDFDGNQIELEFNIDMSNSWNKDFKQTVYLGGSVEGDWNKAITRSLSLDAIHLDVFNDDVVEDMRRLANHAGICHIRTPDGSSFSCDIQVSETKNHDNKLKTNYSLTINAIDAQVLDVVTLESWKKRTEA